MPKKKTAGRLKKVNLKPVQPILTGELLDPEPIDQAEAVAFGKSSRKKKFDGALVSGAVIETETLSTGKTRDVVVVNYYSLEKGTIFMERSTHNPNIWYMNTKAEELTKAATDEYLVYIYYY